MKNEKLTKKEIYATLIELVKAQGEDYANAGEIIERLNKDIELASRTSATRKETDNDRLNKAIQDTIVQVLTDNGTMTYADFTKAVVAQYEDISPQRVTANVTKIKDLVCKFEDGKGKAKKLYIKLV